MLKLRQWTSSSKSAAANNGNTGTDAAASGPAAASSASSSHSTSGANGINIPGSSPRIEQGSILASSAASTHSSTQAGGATATSAQEKALQSDPEQLLQLEVDKRKTGNARLNGAVEALWSSLSKKKALPFDMSDAQLAAVLAQIRRDELGDNQDDEDNAKQNKGKKQRGTVTAALSDLLPGGSKDKEKVDSKMVPISALGIALSSYSTALAEAADNNHIQAVLPSAANTAALSTSLGLLGRAYIQLGQLQAGFSSDIKAVLLTRLARSHVQIDAYMGARKRADAAQSRLESARAKAQKSKREKRELEDELRIASAAYDEAVSELEMRAEAVLFTSEAEDLSALTEHLHAHIDYLQQSVEILESVRQAWAHVDERALNRGINAGSGLGSSATVQDRPRSRAASIISTGANTVRAATTTATRKSGSRPGTGNSISAAVAAGAGRFGIGSGGARQAESTSKNGNTQDYDDDDGESDSALSGEDDDGDEPDSKRGKGRKSPSSKKSRRKSSGSGAVRPVNNRSLSRLSIFGSKKEEGGSSPAATAGDSDRVKESDRAADSAAGATGSPPERPGPTRGWSDTFKAKAWRGGRADKERNTGGFAVFGKGGDGEDAAPLPPGSHVQRLDEEERRRRADLLSGVSIGVDRHEDEGDVVAAPPRLPKRTINAALLSAPAPRRTRTHSSDSYDDDEGDASQSPGLSDADEGRELGHLGGSGGRRESSATTDIFQDGHGVSLGLGGGPLGQHSPFPSDGMGTGPAALPNGSTRPEEEDENGRGGAASYPRLLAFNNTGLSALSAGEDDARAGGGLRAGAGAGTGLGLGSANKRLSAALHQAHAHTDPFGPAPHLQQQDTGLSLGGMTDSNSHEGGGGHADDAGAGEADEEAERAVLTSNGAVSQTQRYRSGGVLRRMKSGGGSSPIIGGGNASGAGSGSGSGTGSMVPAPPVPSPSAFLKNRAPPPPPPPSRGAR